MAKKDSTLSAKDYVHLHTHTTYSLLDGLTKVSDLVNKVDEMGMEAVAITDHGTLSGAIDFYKQAKAKGINPIIGIETYVAARKLTDKEPGKDKLNFHLILLAMNNEGYQNLMALSTIANLEGYYYKPRIDRDILSKHNQGIICLSGCASSEIGEALSQGQYDLAKETTKWYKSVFKDRYYLELQDHGHPKHTSMWDEQQTINEGLMKLSKELDIPMVVTCDAHYLEKNDQEAHEVLLCVQTGSYVTDEDRMTLKDFELYVTDPKDIIARWGKSHPEAITNTKKIAELCKVDIELGKILIPKFPVPKGESEQSYLEKLVYRGLAHRYGKKSEKEAAKLSLAEAKKTLSKDILKRADYELGVINDMGFNGYFLIISDFINWGKNKGIVFGPGRGSAAGSIISYGLRITELDPLEYDLLFERFLNPDRISMPDIDIDIQDSRREEVIQYCIDKYGKDRVANIVTFGRMAARNAVRDTARVLQIPYAESDRLAKMIPPPFQGRHIPLKVSLKEDRDLKNEYATNETSRTIFDLALQLEGTIRSHGVHAAGVVIAPEDIVYYTPLELAQKGVIATQYSMGPIEELGLLKMDFLGLSNLTIINNALKIIKAVYHKDIDINAVPLDDKPTYELFQRGDTTGVFQFESSGMKRYLKELNPTEFDDLIAMNALYRPGPMQFIESFLDHKLGRKEIVYEYPGLKAALENTYGVLIYQEQFMQIAKDMCGFTGGQADTLRKAMGKKQRDTMKKMSADFINGMITHSKVSKSFAEKFWAQLESFADYCFNKSHSACYATIAYQTAYLKAHYPSAFMAALLSSDLDDIDRLAIEISECRHMGIEVLQPDINESFVGFGVVPKTDQIRFGMAAIKNVGTGVVEEILEARESGHFTSMEDFLKRVSVKVTNRKTMESLIKAGAFDRFSDRSTLLYNLDAILAYSSRLKKQIDSGQTDIFGDSPKDIEQNRLELKEAPEQLSQEEQLKWERELLGLYLSKHPLEEYSTYLNENTMPLKLVSKSYDNQLVNVGGLIIDKREIVTRNGQKMAFIKLEDLSGETEIVLFPKLYDSADPTWQRDAIVLIRGRINARDKNGTLTDEAKINVEQAKLLSSETLKSYRVSGETYKLPKTTTQPSIPSTRKPPAPEIARDEKVYIRLKGTGDEQMLLSLKSAIDSDKGQTPVVLVLGEDEGKQAIKLPNGINKDESSLKKLEELVGKDNLVVR